MGSTAGVKRRLPPLLDLLERHALFAAALATGVTLLLSQAWKHLNGDGWLGLVAGREVARNGIPSTDPFTVWGEGARWIDQQWLSQLGMYGLEAAGGLALVVIAYTLLTLAALAMALAAARQLGGSERHVVWVLPLGGLLFLATAIEIRTQGFAYPCFVAVLWLLAADVRSPGRRVVLVLPILALWANLHGSVVLGVGLAVLRGLTVLAGHLPELRQRRFGRWPVVASLCIAAPACLLLTPYGIDGPGYYRETILDPTFRSVITEWQPVTTVWPIAIPFFALAFATLWTLGRAGRSAGLFTQLSLIVLMSSSIGTVRNVSWFGLATLVLLPMVLGEAFGRAAPAPRRRSLNLAIAGVAMASALLAIVVTALRPAAWFEQGYDERTLAVVARAAAEDPARRIYAEGRFADWLLWHQPELAGRLAYDSRLELLSEERLLQLADLSTVTGRDWDRAVRDFDVLVLEPKGKPEATEALLAARDIRAVYEGEDAIVAIRDP